MARRWRYPGRGDVALVIARLDEYFGMRDDENGHGIVVGNEQLATFTMSLASSDPPLTPVAALNSAEEAPRSR